MKERHGTMAVDLAFLGKGDSICLVAVYWGQDEKNGKPRRYYMCREAKSKSQEELDFYV